MGKFDRYKKKNFDAIIGLLIVLWLMKKYSKKEDEEETNKNINENNHNFYDNKDVIEESEEEINTKNSLNNEFPRKLKNKIKNQSYSPVSKEFMREAKLILKKSGKKQDK